MSTENDISYFVRGACFKIYKFLGPGLLESVYEAALVYELTKKGYDVRVQQPISVAYDEILLDIGFRPDLVVNSKVIIEVKSVEKIVDLHFKQILTYLKLSNIRLGLLINFNTVDISKSIHRVVNNLGD